MFFGKTMARFETFDRDIRVATGAIAPEAISAELARFARSELSGAISSGEGSKLYARFVNGREGAAEETVRAPGPILYQFIWWPVVINAALGQLQRLAPARSGRYRKSFIVLANGKSVTDFDGIAADAEVVVTNVQPYSRKIQVGALATVPDSLFNRARQAFQRTVGREIVTCSVRFLDLPAGIHPLVPYVLRTRGRRKDRQRGMRITYPSLVMRLAI